VPISRYFSKPDVQDLLAKASGGDLEGVRSILARQPQLASEKGLGGILPLHAALFARDAIAFETLLTVGLDRHAPADNGISPLMAAAMLPNPRFLAAALADATAAPNQSDVKGRDALHLAVLNRQIANVRLLLAKGADPNRKDARGNTPLMVAFQGRRPLAEIVRALLDAGADPAMVDRTGLKARDFAASFNDPAILALMP
jgi:ankyrin repeat protein